MHVFVPCKHARSRNCASLKQAREKLEKEVSMVKVIREIRYLKIAVKTLLPALKIKKLKIESARSFINPNRPSSNDDRDDNS